ncbi:MAG: hypothetical protein OEY14_06695 [Myxococcales bacterium]|nr:hypothetical protein [Myxococcales bacterium]
MAQARATGAPVVDRRWIDAQILEANRIFAPAGIAFQPEPPQPLAAPFASIRSRRARHALARFAAPRRVNVFIPGYLGDLEAPERPIWGVHWRTRGPHRHHVILSAAAGSDVLAHELGHFFGLGHETGPLNIMSYGRMGGARFDPSQLERIRRFRRRLGRRDRLRTAAGG